MVVNNNCIKKNVVEPIPAEVCDPFMVIPASKLEVLHHTLGEVLHGSSGAKVCRKPMSRSLKIPWQIAIDPRPQRKSSRCRCAVCPFWPRCVAEAQQLDPKLTVAEDRHVMYGIMSVYVHEMHKNRKVYDGNKIHKIFTDISTPFQCTRGSVTRFRGAVDRC